MIAAAPKKRVRSDAYRAMQREWAMQKDVRAARLVRQRAYRTTPTQRVRMRVRTLKHAYGLTAVGFLALVHFQQGRCAICKTSLIEAGTWVDHDHETKRVRGALCPRCNNYAGSSKAHAVFLHKVIVYIEGGPS
jgi:hypothetical protein